MTKHQGDPKSEFRPSWQWTGRELQSALQQWEELSQLSNKISPDEKRLQELQRLLRELKVQLDLLSQK